MAYQVSNPHAVLQRTSVFERPSMSDEPNDEVELRCDLCMQGFSWLPSVLLRCECLLW